MKAVRQSKGAAWGRVITAIPVGYAAVSLVVMALARLIPGDRAQATVLAMLLSFGIYAGLVVYIFAARTALRAFLTTVLIGLTAGAAALLSIWWGGRV